MQVSWRSLKHDNTLIDSAPLEKPGECEWVKKCVNKAKFQAYSCHIWLMGLNSCLRHGNMPFAAWNFKTIKWKSAPMYNSQEWSS